MMSLKITSALALLSLVSASGNYNSFGGAGSGFGAGGGGGYGGSYGGAHIPILRYENKYSYETGNGISAHESRSPRAPGPEGPAVMAEGGFSYRAPAGQQTYTADENSFHLVSLNLPTAPPIPSIE